jgi:hypothetical protein
MDIGIMKGNGEKCFTPQAQQNRYESRAWNVRGLTPP